MPKDTFAYYILEFASHGGEPLYILLSASVEENLADSYEEAIKGIYDLYIDKYLKCNWHSLKQGDFVVIKDLGMEHLLKYLEKNKKYGFHDYPGEGGEYFFETTNEGEIIIPEDYCPPY